MKKFAALLLLLVVTAARAAFVAGNPQGNITCIEVFDYACSHCRNMAPVMDKLAAHNPEVRFEARPIVTQPASQFLTRASIAMALYVKQNFHDWLLQQPHTPNQEAVLAEVGRRHVAKEDFVQAMQSPEVTQALLENSEFAKQQHINAIPFFIIQRTDGKGMSYRLAGETRAAVIQQAIDLIRKRNHK